jgi:hypothetical protein
MWAFVASPALHSVPAASRQSPRTYEYPRLRLLSPVTAPEHRLENLSIGNVSSPCLAGLLSSIHNATLRYDQATILRPGLYNAVFLQIDFFLGILFIVL